MTITQKTVAALLAVFLALLASAAFVLDRSMRPQFEQLESSLHERNQARVEANLSAITDDIRARVMDYSNWDDTYDFIADHNSAYTADFTDDWLTDYGIDLAVFGDFAGHLILVKQSNQSGALAVRPTSTAALLAEVRAAAGHNDSVSGVVWIEGMGPVMVAAHHVLRSDGSGPPRGWVIMGRRLSAQALHEQTQLHVETINAAEAPPDLSGHIAALGTASTRSWSTPERIYSLRALRDVAGRLSGVVLTSQEREVVALGDGAIRMALALVAVLFFGAAAALWMLLRAIVIRRVERLEQHLNGQDATLTPLELAPGRHDEIARLTAAYNRLAARLQDSAHRERTAILEREAAAAANRMKSDFLANISRELREPMDAIIGYAELVQEEIAGRGLDIVGVDVGRIREAAKRQLAVIEEIFDLSKIEAGRLELKCESFKVAEMVSTAVKMAMPAAESRSTSVHVEIEGDLGTAYSDSRRLRQCLTSMLSNACRLAARGQVRLMASRTISPNGDMLVFRVRDDGAALTDAQLARAFEPFVELDATLSKRLGGAGLGLAITRKMLTLLGGRLDATNTGDRGSEFTLTVPAILEEPTRGPIAKRAA